MSKDTHFTIFSHSLSCLQSLHNMNNEHPLILNILCNYWIASRQGKIVNLFWIPSLIGNHGNDKADTAAKSEFQFEIIKFRIPCID